jgi:hypothetical protein
MLTEGPREWLYGHHPGQRCEEYDLSMELRLVVRRLSMSGISRKLTGEDQYGANLMSLVKLLQRDCVVQRSHLHITAVHDLCP